MEDSCRPSAGSVASGFSDTLRVVLSEPVDIAHALHPTNDSERLVFGTIFETLIYLDCRAEVRPGLAERWESDSSGRIWTFRLRDDVSSTGGSSAAMDAASSWQAHPEAMTAGGIESVAALGDNRLRVTMLARHDSVPPTLADPALGILHGRGSILGRADRFLIPMPRSSPPAIEFRVEPDTDPRDALDHGADVLVTRDPALVDYVSNRPEVVTFPLLWSRTYVLAHTDELPSQLITDLSTGATRSSLAKDVVGATARAAESPYWRSDLQACGALTTLQAAGAAPRVVYRKDDRVARGLAERVVALASASSGLRAVGLEPAQFDQAVRNGTERAYVIGLPRQSLAPCRDARMLPPGARLLSLIDTRAYAIARKGVPQLTVEWDGTLRLVGP